MTKRTTAHKARRATQGNTVGHSTEVLRTHRPPVSTTNTMKTTRKRRTLTTTNEKRENNNTESTPGKAKRHKAAARSPASDTSRAAPAGAAKLPPRGSAGGGAGARGAHGDEPKTQVTPPETTKAAVGLRKKRSQRTTSARNHVNQTNTQTQVFKHRRHEGAPAQLVVPSMYRRRCVRQQTAERLSGGSGWVQQSCTRTGTR
jgi:hypothetical protein